MIVGETVVVERDAPTVTTDPFGAPVTSIEVEVVPNVLVSPGPLTDVVDSVRPDGVRVVWSLHFPKPYARSLRGARVSVRGGPGLHVVGDPQPYTAENTPGEWWMPVEVGEVDG